MKKQVGSGSQSILLKGPYFQFRKKIHFWYFKVTIAGESAGSMSVMTLYLSNAAKGLFHGAIAQSGVLNMPMLYEIEPSINQLRQVCQNKNIPITKTE